MLLHDKDILLDIFYKANKDFLQSNLNNILAGTSERNWCALLMVEMKKHLSKSIYKDYYVDVEYNRNNRKIKTIMNEKEEIIVVECDLIIHSRGENIKQDNLLALEMKKSTAPSIQKNKDKKRLIALTKSSYNDVWSYDGTTLPEHVCRYLIGIYYEINIIDKTILLEFYSDGNFLYSLNKSFEFYIDYPESI